MSYFEPSLRRKRTIKKTNWTRIVLYLALFASILHFVVEPQIVLAETTPVYSYPGKEMPKQNDYYCGLIRDKGVSVGAAMSQVAELCAKEGITI